MSDQPGYPPPPQGYPPQQGYPPPGYPGYPPQPGYSGYPPQPGYSGYPPQQGYPAPGYPPQQQYRGYPLPGPPPPPWAQTGGPRPAHRSGRFPPVLKIAAIVAVMVVIGTVLKDRITPGPPSRCVFSCTTPPIGSPVPVGQTFTSSAYGFAFDYPPGAHQGNVHGDGVVQLTWSGQPGVGILYVAVSKTGSSPQQVIDQEATHLSSGDSSLQSAGSIPGAEIGFVNGVGQAYSGAFTDSSGSQVPVAIAIVAVQHGPQVVYLVGVSTVDSNQSTPFFFQYFNDVVVRWRWTS